MNRFLYRRGHICKNESGLILKAVYGELRTEEVLRLKFERGGISP